MNMDYLEEVAQEKGLGERARARFESLMDEVAHWEERHILWKRLRLLTMGIFLWTVLVACILFLLGLDYEYQLPEGTGVFLTIVLAIFFPLMLLSIFMSEKYLRRVTAAEARVLGFVESL